MRIAKLFTVVCFIILVTSCTSDDMTALDTRAQASDLVGTWNLIEESQEGTGKVTLQGIPVTGTITSMGKDFDATITFTENPNILMAAGSYTEVITASFATINRTEEIPVVLNNELSQGAWSLNEGVITLSGGSEIQDVNIIELTSTRLKIEIPIKRDVVIEGSNVEVDTTIKMTFDKQ